MTKGRAALDSLPELPLEPLELAGRLGHAGEGPYLTIVPHARPSPAIVPPARESATEPGVLPLGPNRSSYQVRDYWVQTTYPYVYCQFPGDLVDGIVLDSARQTGAGAADEHLRDRPGLVAPVQRFKLSVFEGRRLPHPLFCTVKYGPWVGKVRETESCIDGVPSQWELVLVGVPLNVGMTWSGGWLEQPTLPNLTVIKGTLALAHVGTQCCAGYKWCPTTQSCIPNRVNCMPNVPA